LKRDTFADVLVIGAGISGAMIADAISDAGLTVLVADRRGPLLGSTPASTALSQYELDVPLSRLSTMIGSVKAERLWRRSRLALDALRERQRCLGIDACAVNRDAIELDGTVLNEEGLMQEVEARRRAGFETMFLAKRVVHERFGIHRRSAILSYDNLAVDPRRLADGFFRAALARKTKIMVPVEVTEISTNASSVVATTKHGPTIRVRHLIFATGYEFPTVVPQNGHKIISTWAIATRPQPRRLWPERCFIWEASDPYLYLRVTPDCRIICGGEDEDFADEARRDAKLPMKTAVLQRKLKQLFPHVNPRAEFAWCGSFGTTRTGSPTIGPIPRKPRCYAALGYGGNGITFSMMAAQMLRGMIMGVGDPDADLVSFNRGW
jgi:glycine/D-amino acid oxidase-like deaminating enzyme